MATIFRTLSYKYQWLYDTISRLAALGVGGEERFRQLAFQGLEIKKDADILDLCCGAAPVTQFLVRYSSKVIGLDASPVALQRAAQNVPQARYVEGLAQKIPLPDAQFDLVHVSAAIHEMNDQEILQIFEEVYRVLKPGGVFTLVDFHKPDNWLFWPPLAVFLWLFETETAWQLLKIDLIQILKSIGFGQCKQYLYTGGSLQVIQAWK